MILIHDLSLSLDTDFNDLVPIVAKTLQIPQNNIKSARLFRRSVDARHKNDVHFCCSVLVDTTQKSQALKHCKKATVYAPKIYEWPHSEQPITHRPVVVGFGPAGMFAALSLARAGLRPIVIERGQDADTRTADVAAFFAGGALNPESNVQFGEGGAGTFSDGKLNSGIKDPRCRTVLEELVHFGAPDDILIDAKPHIGTDILIHVVKNLRHEVIANGGDVRFGNRLEDLVFEDGQLSGILVNGELLPCCEVILATGHSARDTFEMLQKHSISLIRKPFAMGVRIEHLQENINRALYGEFAKHPALHAADYKLAAHLPDGRGVYTFCMCPGGEVINASSEIGRIAVNGMSNSRRDGVNANSALLVEVLPEDLPGNEVLAGCTLQRRIEQKAYEVSGGGVPVETVGHFLTGQNTPATVMPTVKPRPVRCDLKEIFPDFITDSLKKALPILDEKIDGFADPGAVLTAPETRSSSPVRIVRSENGQSCSLPGLFPCGEGAGYAGGILSAAVDGLRTAEKVIAHLAQKTH